MIKYDIHGNPVVIHYGAKKFTASKFSVITNDWVKPRGGLWTSPIDSDYGWKDWCEAENFRDCDDSMSFTLEFNSDVKIYKIDTLKDLLNLPLISLHVPSMKHPDFETISKEYDAIWLTENGQHVTRFSRPCNLYGWDCESILILNPKCFTQK
jgi:hypothetical protein